MTKERFLSALHAGAMKDLKISDSARQNVLGNSWVEPYLTSVIQTAEQLRGTPIPVIPYSYFKLFHETGDRLTFESGPYGYFPRRKRLVAFAILSWLYGREEDLKELADIIWAICDEYTWALAAHVKPEAYTTKLEDEGYMVDLFAAETAQSLAEISFLLKDALPTILCRRISYLIRHRVIEPVMQNTFRWTGAASNWAAVCAGSVGMAAIYTLKDEEDLLAQVLERLWPSLESFLTSFSQEGVCMEGLGYWNYGFSYYVSFAELLQRRTNAEIDLLGQEKVRKIALFQQKCYFAGGRTVSFSDSSSRVRYLPGLTCFLKRRFPDVQIPPAEAMQDFHSDACYRWSNVFRNLLWASQSPETGTIGGSYPLPDAQWYLCSAANGSGIAAKAGHNAEPHNHNDVGSFQLFHNGEEILCDFGSGEYTRHYFAEQRYTFMNCGSQGHNLPMIDGQTQIAGRKAAARNVRVDENGISMELADTYPVDELTSLRREIAFNKKTGITHLKDTFVFEQEGHTLCERFVTLGVVRIVPGRVQIFCGKQKAQILYNSNLLSAEIRHGTYAGHEGAQVHFSVIEFCAVAEKTTYVDFKIGEMGSF